MPAPRSLFVGHEADGDEGVEQGGREVVGAERGDENSVEGRKALRQGRGTSAGAAGLREEVHRGDEGVAHEGPGEQQHQPRRARGGELSALHREQGADAT